MSVIGSNILAGASGQGGGYNLTRSLRFRGSAEAYLSRTPSNTATSGTTWTVSYWFKVNVGSSASRRCGFSAGNADATGGSIQFLVTWQGYSQDYKMCIVTGQGTTSITTSGVFRDPSAWYHVVVACDTTQATASNRWKIYVNGVQQSIGADAFGGSANYPTQNTTFRWNASGQANLIGATDESGTKVFFMDGYIAEFNNIDGQALTPSSFGETSATTGVWQPKKYAGTYGTNGFYLPFTDNSALTTSSNVGLGKDFSGNGNYWATNNISITSGVTYDSMTDVPTLTSATASNFCVLNPLSKGTNISITNGNLSASYGSAAWTSAFGTLGVSTGKWYWEATLTSAGTDVGVGISTNPAGSANSYIGGDVNSWGYYANNGNKWNNGSSSSYGATYANGDVIGIALDLDAGTLTFYKNNTSQGTAFSSLASNTYFPALSVNNSSFAANFGQRPFAYTPPSGFVALNTFNLPTPTIGATASTQANKYFDATTYTGNGSTQSITNAGGFQPDFVWMKIRSLAYDHTLQDAIRGTTKYLNSNNTAAEDNATTLLTSFNSNGFSLGNSGNVNQNSQTYVAWQWKGANSTVSNTAGSITSTVSANTSSGFSIVTYTGNGAVGATVGHGLGVAPSMIILKRRTGATASWLVWHRSLSNLNNNYLLLDSTSGQLSSTNIWGTQTSSVIALDTDSLVNEQNANGSTFVAYCFSEVQGYSKFGSYTGNGSADGTFVYTGFRPRFVLVKRTDTTANWILIDTARDTYNASGLELFPNLSNAENDNRPELDVLSNGFKLRWTYTGTNASGGNYVYACFAEHPFKYSLGK
jgi:hypothetical protein